MNTTDMRIKNDMEKDKEKIDTENANDEISNLQKVVEVGTKTEEMIKTEGWLYLENEIKYRIEEAIAIIFDVNLDPAKKTTEVVRAIERAATYKELISKIKEVVEKKNIAIARISELKKK